ncbi:MAG: zf-TFIIB domain-containing protein [Myxococcota bacterium]
MALRCPRCADAMYVGATPAGGDMWGCPRCGGVWLDLATADHVVRTVCEGSLALSRRAADAAAQPSRPQAMLLQCPVCTHTMEPQRVATAWLDIDVCRAHGTWYDHGELEKVARATQRDVGDWRSRPAAAPAVGAVAGGAAVGVATHEAAGASFLDTGAGEVAAEVAVEAGSWALFAIIEALFD